MTAKRPRDPNQLGKLVVVDIATGESNEPKTPNEKDPAAIIRGRARSQALSPKQRSEIARKAARASWAQGRTEKG